MLPCPVIRCQQAVVRNAPASNAYDGVCRYVQIVAYPDQGGQDKVVDMLYVELASAIA